MLQTTWFPEVSKEQVIIARSWSWVLLAVLCVLIHIFVLGPGVEF
jgi:hypothetical protein